MNKLPEQEELNQLAEPFQQLQQNLKQVLFGQDELIECVVVALISGGHVLLEGLPGLGKTELIKGLGACLGASFRRIQFTPDLLPSDITGFQILEPNRETTTFKFEKGPLFANLVLADEINRASPKTQSAMLEAMQERCVTLSGTTHPLPDPFFVMATQNPIELEGTYSLPEAQLDRFLFKLPIHLNDREVVKKIILGRDLGVSPEPQKCLEIEDLTQAIQVARKIYLPEPVVEAISWLVHLAQPSSEGVGRYIKYGAGPRAAIALSSALKAKALLSGRINASVQDMLLFAGHVLRHRILLTAEARINRLDVDKVIALLLEEVREKETSLPVALEKVSN
jgi:MoxR-like ATPase